MGYVWTDVKLNLKNITKYFPYQAYFDFFLKRTILSYFINLQVLVS